MLLEVSNLSKAYKRGNQVFFAVKDVWLKLKEGDYTIIIGRSGSGKSTLLNLIGGLLTPSSGEINVAGRNTSSLSDSELSFLRNLVIGYIPQGHSALSNLTVFDNVRLPYFLHKGKEDVDIEEIDKRAISLLEKVGIAHLASAYPKNLSGGELRRVSIARALIKEPKLVLADEPTNDLDTHTSKEVMSLFSEIASQGTAVLLVTHDLDSIGYGNSVYQMNDGNLFAHKT